MVREESFLCSRQHIKSTQRTLPAAHRTLFTFSTTLLTCHFEVVVKPATTTSLFLFLIGWTLLFLSWRCLIIFLIFIRSCIWVTTLVPTSAFLLIQILVILLVLLLAFTGFRTTLFILTVVFCSIVLLWYIRWSLQGHFPNLVFFIIFPISKINLFSRIVLLLLLGPWTSEILQFDLLSADRFNFLDLLGGLRYFRR